MSVQLYKRANPIKFQQIASATVLIQKGKISFKMLRFVAILAFAAVAQAAPGGGHFAYGHQQKHCHTKYNIKLEQA